jgi:hypothetical protein
MKERTETVGLTPCSEHDRWMGGCGACEGATERAAERKVADLETRLRVQGEAFDAAHAEDLATFVRLEARVKELEGDLHAAIVEAREHEERANASDHFILKVDDGHDGEIDVCDRIDGHSHRYVPTSELDGVRRQAIREAVQAISGVPDEELGVSAAVALSRAIVRVNSLIDDATLTTESIS